METIKIHGKEYVMVKDRVLHFNAEYKNGAIKTEMVKNDDVSVVFKATVIPDLEKPERTFTGYAESSKTATGIEGQSPIEVAETSAIGRALAAMGIGVKESYASADEVAVKGSEERLNAPQREETPKRQNVARNDRLATDKQKKFISSLIMERNLPMPDEQWFYELNAAAASKKIEELKATPIATHEVIDESFRKVKHDEDLEHPEPNDDEEDRINREVEAAVERDRDNFSDVDRGL